VFKARYQDYLTSTERRDLDSVVNNRDVGTINVSSSSLLAVVLQSLVSFRGHSHLGSESRVRLPSGRVSRRLGLFHHSVNLLEGQTLGLPDKEVTVEVSFLFPIVWE